MTIEELDALPEGTKVRDHSVDGALWVKYPDGSWHLIEQADGWYTEGYDWSAWPGDTSANVWDRGEVELSVVE